MTEIGVVSPCVLIYTLYHSRGNTSLGFIYSFQSYISMILLLIPFLHLKKKEETDLFHYA